MAEVTPFMERAFDYFTQQGYSPQAAAALAGHGQWESSGSSTIQDPRGEGSIGLYQWRLDRRQGLNDFARARGLDPLNENTQLAYTDWELKNTERGAGDSLRGAQTSDEANAAMMNFLRPAGWTSQNPQGGHAWANRVALSQALLGGEMPSTSRAPASAAPASIPMGLMQRGDVPSPDGQPTESEPSLWNAVAGSGRQLASLGGASAPQVAAMRAPESVAPAPTVHRGRPVSLLDLIFASRPRSNTHARG